MKRLIATLILASMVVTLVACGNNPKNVPVENPTISQEIESVTESLEQSNDTINNVLDDETENDEIVISTPEPLAKGQTYVSADSLDKTKLGFRLSTYGNHEDVFIGINVENSATLLDFMMDEYKTDVFPEHEYDDTITTIDQYQDDYLGIHINQNNEKYDDEDIYLPMKTVFEFCKMDDSGNVVTIDNNSVVYTDEPWLIKDTNLDDSFEIHYVIDSDGAGRGEYRAVEIGGIIHGLDVAKEYLDTIKKIVCVGIKASNGETYISADGDSVAIDEYKDIRDIMLEVLNSYGLYVDSSYQLQYESYGWDGIVVGDDNDDHGATVEQISKTKWQEKQDEPLTEFEVNGLVLYNNPKYATNFYLPTSDGEALYIDILDFDVSAEENINTLKTIFSAE